MKLEAGKLYIAARNFRISQQDSTHVKTGEVVMCVKEASTIDWGGIGQGLLLYGEKTFAYTYDSPVHIRSEHYFEKVPEKQ